jgi:poly-gamma-glutamate capsule biosynthesis protein CapA/YwtB (metallophosphatase superfamily)
LLTGEGPVKKCQNPSVCYAFKSPNHYAGYLKEAGFDVVSVANNHVGDFGDAGRENTAKVLEEYGIWFAGLEKYPYSIFTLNGVTYGFCAFAPNTGTVKINDYERSQKIIKHLDTSAQVVIVSFHGGAEGPSYNRITRQTEMFLGENRGNPYEFARMAIDAGADIVLGHGPHVPRAVDVYKNRFIAYSLGNFCTYGRFNLKGPNGLAPVLKVKMTKEGEFLEAEIISAKQLGEGGPTPDTEREAYKEIKRLTQADFPDAKLQFIEDGKILPKK